MLTPLSTKASLESLPTEIFQHICWLSLNPSLYLINKYVTSLLPAYSAYEHDLCLTIFVASPPYGAWAKLPPSRLFLTPAAKAYPQTYLYSTSPSLRLDAQRHLLIHPWLTLRKFHHHVLPTLARTWVDTHWDGFSNESTQARQDLAKFVTDYYTKGLDIWDEQVVSLVGEFTWDREDGLGSQILYVHPKGLGIEQVCKEHVKKSDTRASGPSKSIRLPKPLADIRCIPDWVLHQAGSKADWTSVVSSRWIEDAARAEGMRWSTDHQAPISPGAIIRHETQLLKLEFNPALLARVAIQSLELDQEYDSGSGAFGTWTVTPLWSSCADEAGARKAAVTVIYAAARMQQWKYVLRNIDLRSYCLSSDAEVRREILPLVREAEAEAVRNGEGNQANMGGRVWAYGSLWFITMLREKLEEQEKEHERELARGG